MSDVHSLRNLREYHRPVDADTTTGLQRALELLARPGLHTAPLAGGDTLIGSGDLTVEAVVDLQGLGLDVITTDAHTALLRIGAMVTRADLAAAPAALAGPFSRLLVAAAGRGGGSVQRNRATLGGAVATAAADDPLIVALLACDADVVLYSAAGQQALALAEFLPRRHDLLAQPALITEVLTPLPVALTGYGLADVARTPADAPIVVAAAALTLAAGRCLAARVALGGVASAPVRLPAAEALCVGQPITPDRLAAAGAHAAELAEPVGDFRGSAAYRKAMAGVLVERALYEAWQQAQ